MYNTLALLRFLSVCRALPCRTARPHRRARGLSKSHSRAQQYLRVCLNFRTALRNGFFTFITARTRTIARQPCPRATFPHHTAGISFFSSVWQTLSRTFTIALFIFGATRHFFYFSSSCDKGVTCETGRGDTERGDGDATECWALRRALREARSSRVRGKNK